MEGWSEHLAEGGARPDQIVRSNWPWLDQLVALTS